MIFLIIFSFIADCRDVVSTKYRVILHTYVLDRNLQKGQATAHTAMQPDYQLRDKIGVS